MKDEMTYFLVTEASIARDSNREMSANFVFEVVFVICNESEKETNLLPESCQFKSIFPLCNMNIEEMAKIITEQCKLFREEKAIFIDCDISPQEKSSQLHNLLSESLETIKAHAYYIDFRGDQEDKDFIEIKEENNDPMLFDRIQNFDDTLKKDICI
ncbi:MAG: hypothetical protein LBJ13_00750 [Puniceicoccales bacterium]|jgi:hypothetical protein|nr:hypothetical protein [Puniceicoccales bacterium]